LMDCGRNGVPGVLWQPGICGEVWIQFRLNT